MQTFSVYALCEPASDEIRDVGVTRRSLSYRLQRHIEISTKRSAPKDLWIRSLTARSLKPTIKLLEKVDDASWEEAERKWIAYFREHNAQLTNTMPGGKRSSADYRNLPALRAKISEGQKRYFADHINRSKRSKIMKDYYTSVDHTLISERAKRTNTLEVRTKISQSMIGLTRSAETRLRMSIASKEREAKKRAERAKKGVS